MGTDAEMETHDGAQTTTEQVTGGPAEDAGLDTKCVFCKQDVSETSEPQLLPCLHTACKLCIPTDPTGEQAISTRFILPRKRSNSACSR